MGTKAKIAITIGVVALGVGYMILTTISSGDALQYYKHVDEVMVDPARWRDRRLQLHGNVVAGTIEKKPGSLDFRFALHRGTHWVDVTYTGIVPDSFKDCAELVVIGKLSGERSFGAVELAAKCPSKYDGERRSGCGEPLRNEVFAARQMNRR